MAKFTGFKMDGLDEVLKGIDQFTDEAKEDLDIELQASADKIAGDAKGNVRGHADTGRMAQSISAARNGLLDHEVVAQSGYAAFREFGTGTKVSIPPGLEEYAKQFDDQKGGTWAEFEANMREWLRRHGIEEKALYPMMRQIYLKGSEPAPFLFPAYDKEKAELIKRLKKRFGNG